jgi:hypothetical protein
MTANITKVPGTNLYVDEGYNLCNQSGVLYAYTYGNSTIPLDDYLETLGPAIKRRQDEGGYPTGDIGLTDLIWDQMQYTWLDERRCFGLRGMYLYIRNGNLAKPAPGRSDANGLVLLCKSGWAQINGNTVRVRAGPERLAIIKRSDPNKPVLIPDDMFTNRIAQRNLALQGNSRMC